MDRRREALRRLGAAFCDACMNIAGEDDGLVVTSVPAEHHKVFASLFGADAARKVGPGPLTMCGPCRESMRSALDADMARHFRESVEARVRELRNSYENSRDVARLIEPNSHSYAREVRRHKAYIREAMRMNGGLGVFGGGED